jgi:hypothetical protein
MHSTYYGSQPLFKSAFSSPLNGSLESTQQLIQWAKEGKEI